MFDFRPLFTVSDSVCQFVSAVSAVHQEARILPPCQKESLVVCTHSVHSHVQKSMLSRLSLASRSGSDPLHAWPVLAQGTVVEE